MILHLCRHRRGQMDCVRQFDPCHCTDFGGFYENVPADWQQFNMLLIFKKLKHRLYVVFAAFSHWFDQTFRKCELT